MAAAAKVKTLVLSHLVGGAGPRGGAPADPYRPEIQKFFDGAVIVGHRSVADLNRGATGPPPRGPPHSNLLACRMSSIEYDVIRKTRERISLHAKTRTLSHRTRCKTHRRTAGEYGYDDPPDFTAHVLQPERDRCHQPKVSGAEISRTEEYVDTSGPILTRSF